MHEIEVTTPQPITAAAIELDQNIWHAWLAKNRTGELRLGERMRIALVFSPLVLAFAWFWFRM